MLYTRLRFSAFAGHNIQHALVGFIHRVGAYADKVSDTLVYVFVYDSFYRRYAVALHGQHRRKHCCADARGQLQGAAGLCSVANHTCQIGDHVLHSKRHLFIRASHQIRNSATGTCCCHHTAAEGREGAEVLLDVDSCVMAEHLGARHLLCCVVVLFGKDHHGVCGADALVATARIAHHGNHGAGHAGVAGQSGA